MRRRYSPFDRECDGRGSGALCRDAVCPGGCGEPEDYRRDPVSTVPVPLPVTDEEPW